MAITATKLYKARRKLCRLSPLILMTDPVRLPDPISAAQKLPYGATLIYRHYGAEDRSEMANKLRQITFAKRQQFLIGHDPSLAIDCGADGVHFRRDRFAASPTLWRKRCPDWIITMAGVKDNQPYQGSLAVLDALFVSSIFPSQSPSAGTPIGTEKLRAICADSQVPVIALGGINAATAQQLIGTGAAGLSGISGI